MNFQANWVDLVIILFLVFFFFDGIRNGFLIGFANLFGFILAFFASLNFYPYLGSFLTNYFDVPQSFSNAIAFFVIWLLTENLYIFTLRPLFPKKVLPQKFKILERLLGVFPALASGILLAIFILILVVSLPFPGNVKKDIFASEIAPYLIKWGSRFEKPLERALGGAVQDTLAFVTVPTQSEERIDLGFKQEIYSVDEVSEERMHELVNLERVQQGINPLVIDKDLQRVARAYSEDMLKRGYFSHNSPEGEDASDRLDRAGIRFFVAGENLAYAPNVEIAHQGLMASEGHRKNILASEFQKVGIGVIDGGKYGKMFTQVFTN